MGLTQRELAFLEQHHRGAMVEERRLIYQFEVVRAYGLY